MEQTKGIVKVCPTCEKPMALIKLGMGSVSLYYWVCWECPQLINYQSVEASELKEVEVT